MTSTTTTPELTPLEIEVVDQLCKGQLIKQVAYSLGISVDAIDQRLKKARTRNEVSTTLYLCVLWATREIES